MLSLTLDFLQVSSGRLLLTQAENTTLLRKEVPGVNIEDITTNTELQLACLHNSNELTFQLRTASGVICISFIWDNCKFDR